MGAAFDDLEVGRCHRRGRFAVEMALTLQGKPQRVQPVGQAAHKRGLPAHMFQQQETAVRPQYSSHFGQSPRRIRDAAKDERADYDIKGVVGKGQVLGVGGLEGDASGTAKFVHDPGGGCKAFGINVYGGDLSGRWIKRQVRTATDSYL